ncbi:hypothetical protein MYAM1_003945 [Malassezia yamatoensis]|uniref:COP9 signalosome complex subunit 4 n=1 Tax=Malassezia yamatoensis TaxID=253288 RepID=A0AAJ5YXR2_9BASI|nr:hypothetical protein MYAM1_003945 [Malassezia yamatoensis]
MSSMETRIGDIGQITAVGERVEAMKQLLDDVMQLQDIQMTTAIQTYVQDAILNRANLSGAGLIAARESLSLLNQRLKEANESKKGVLANEPVYIEVLRGIVEACRDHSNALEDQLADTRIELADHLESQRQWTDAIQLLETTVSNNQLRSKSETYWLRVYVRLMRLYLMGDALASADLYLKKASSLLHALQLDSAQPDASPLLFEFRQYQAELYDRQQRFYDAALRFQNLCATKDLSHNKQADFFLRSILCAVLAPVSQQRSRLIEQLSVDPRVDSPRWAEVLNKLARKQLIREETMHFVDQYLLPHQKTKSIDSEASVLIHAIAEHNVQACSFYYTSTSFASLSKVLHLSVDASEALVAQMIVREKLPGTCCIDQVAGVVNFGYNEPQSSQRSIEDADHDLDIKSANQSVDLENISRQCRDRRTKASLAYLSEAYAMLQKS